MLLLYFIFIKTILSNEILQYSIEEKSPINTFVTDLSNDFHLNSYVSFELIELIPSNKHLFLINNQTGYLTTNKILNRDDMCLKKQCSCNSCDIFYGLVIKLEQEILYKILEINIKDRNDHSPIFDEQSITRIIYVKQNVPLGYRIILPVANDPDEGTNSIQSYSLQGICFDDFDIDYSSIEIPYLIIRSLHMSSYSLTLTASDISQSGSIQLDIRIINESIPIFQQNVYTIDVREDVPLGKNLLKIRAVSDNDQEISYEFLSESSFVIDRLTGNIQLKETLDYEKEKSYRLTVKAYENLIPTYAIVFIHVIDINDNPVLIHIKPEGNTTLQQNKILSIPEDTSIGTVLAHITLNDLDSFVNGNPYLQITTTHPPLPIIYKLIYQNNFQNTKFYSLILNKNLDRESQSIYSNIQLIAYDSGTPVLHTRLSLILNLTDINDCIPQLLTNSTIYNINENNPIGLIIDTLKSYDCDLGVNSQFEYNLLNKTDLLKINSQTGQMILNQSIDFEEYNHEKKVAFINLIFFIEIKDHGQPSLSNQIKIILRIHDLNDNSPIFDSTKSYNWSFSQSLLQPGSVLGRIFAYDNDSGLQGIVHYSINSLDSCLILNITSLGYVYLLSESSSCSFSSFSFEIIASDYGTPNSRLTKHLLTIHIDEDLEFINPLPQLVSLTNPRIFADRNSIGYISFILDITTNHSINPRIYLNNSDLSTYWNISSTGEIYLQSQPNFSSYLLILNIIDEYTEENYLIKIYINICNSTIENSCKQIQLKDNDISLFSAICLASIITCLCVLICSIIICMCCQKKTKKKNVSIKQYNPDFQRTFKSSITDDRDSTCVMNTKSSSLSSGILLNQTNSWHYKLSNNDNYQPSTYFYDIKLAELIRNNQNQSLSSDYGSQLSPSLTSSSPSSLNRKNCFISTHEYVV